MMYFNRTQWFEIICSLIIFAVGFVLAYNNYTSWVLSIVASVLFVVSLGRALHQSTKSRGRRVKSRA